MALLDYSIDQVPSNNVKNLKQYIRFMSNLHITQLILPPNESKLQYTDDFYICNCNPHLTVVIIEKMSLGIVMTDYLANQFDYIRCILERQQHKTFAFTNMKVVIINEEWDIHLWNQYKLERFYNYMYSYISKYNTINALKNSIDDSPFIKDYIDFHFLESLSWNNE